MRKLEDLVGNRVLSSGVFEYHPRSGTVRGRILYIELSEHNVEFTIVNMEKWEENAWKKVEYNSGVDRFMFNKETIVYGTDRPQFDFNGGWVIIYPNTDSVRIA